MAELPKSLHDYTAFVDGTDYAGRISEGELPPLELATQEVDSGGIAANYDVDVGRMNAMTSTLTFAEHTPALYSLFGRSDVPVTFRAAQGQSVDTAEAVIVEMRGLFKKLDPGTLKTNDKTAMKIDCSIRFLRIEIAGQEVVKIDIENQIRMIGGVDQLQAIRTALGK